MSHRFSTKLALTVGLAIGTVIVSAGISSVLRFASGESIVLDTKWDQPYRSQISSQAHGFIVEKGAWTTF